MSKSSRNNRVQQAMHTFKRVGIKGSRGACIFCADEGHVDKKRSLFVNVWGVYYCYRCGTTGRVPTDEDPPPTDWRVRGVLADDTAALTPIEPPKGFFSLSTHPGSSSETFKPVREYVVDRFIDTDTPWEVVAEAQLGACADVEWSGWENQMWCNRVIAPFLADDQETWLGFVGRTVLDSARVLKYLYPSGIARSQILYNRRVLDEPTDEPALVVEGAFDTFPFYDRAAALLGEASHQQLEIIKNGKRPSCFVLDGDAWRKGWALAARMRTEGCRSGHVRLPPRTDPDEVPRGWLFEEARRSLEAKL